MRGAANAYTTVLELLCVTVAMSQWWENMVYGILGSCGVWNIQCMSGLWERQCLGNF